MAEKYKPLVRRVGMVIATISLLTICYQLWLAWPQLKGVRIAVAPALLALIVISLNLTAVGLLWRNVLQRVGSDIALPVAITTWFLAQVVRYAPGNVWHLLGRVYMTQQLGVPAQSTSLSMVFELLHAVTAGLLVTVLSLLFWQHDVLNLAVLLVLPFLVCYLWPQILHRPLTLILRRAGVKSEDLTIRRRDMFAMLPGYGGTWLVYGGSMYLLVNALYPLPITTLPAIIGIYAFSWVIGFLSFITPSGLGVREGVLSYLFSFVMPVPVALLMAILSRVWMIVGELLCVGLILLGKRRINETA